MFEKYNIKEIRILTTSSELEFETEDDIREYLRYTLPKNCEGRYYYRRKGIVIDKEDQKNMLVLFWYRNKGIGCGVMYHREPEDTGISKGYLCFYPETIFNISDITEEEIHRFSSIPKEIKQGSPKIDIKALKDILNLIYEKWRDYKD
ncbi:MAG: hypothetical protein HFG39_15860 [Lachnospiraceae bacterium]|nr:hypothetical protein [Lachnospiraceae bacterium]